MSSRVTHPLPRRTLDCTQGEKTPGLKPQVLAAAAAGQVMGRTGPGDVGLGRGSPHVGELLKGFRETFYYHCSSKLGLAKVTMAHHKKWGRGTVIVFLTEILLASSKLHPL